MWRAQNVGPDHGEQCDPSRSGEHGQWYWYCLQILAGKLRSQGVAIPDPPFRTRELLDDTVAAAPVVLVVGTSNFREMEFVSEKFKVFTLSIPGFDACKGQKGRIKSAIDEGLLMAKDFCGGGR